MDRRIRSDEAQHTRPRSASFGLLFRSVLPELEELHWITGHDSFGGFPPQWIETSVYDPELDRYVSGPLKDFDDLELAAADQHVLRAPGLLPKYADCVSEDWNDIFGLRGAAADLAAWLARRYSRDRARHVAETVEVCFFNLDGACWEFHARDPELLRTVRADLETVPGCRLAPARLDESTGL